MSSTFNALAAINVNDKTEKKGKFAYLSWAWAWKTFVQNYPEATYEIVKNELNLPYFNSEAGGMVYTKVTAGGITHEMWLPIMDMQNKAKKQFDMMDVNKTVMRCLVKNLAMFGLGLYIYAGEDLPEEDIQEEDLTEGRIMLADIISRAQDINNTTQWILTNYKVDNVSSLNGEQLKHVINILSQKKKNADTKS
jgi:hypothetical protein